MDIVERIQQRIELFSPGGDNERLLQEAADEIVRLRRERDDYVESVHNARVALKELREVYQRGER